MTQEQFLDRLKACYEQNVEISQRKNADYADVQDPFKNFRMCEGLGISAEQGLIVRILDKVTRASNLLTRDAKVEDEKIGDTLSDLANYAMILRIFIEQKHERSR